MYGNVLGKLAFIGLATALAGCNLALPGQSNSDPVSRLDLVGGDVVAAGPRDYCVDARMSRPSDGLALMAACSVLTGEGAVPWRNAVIAMQVGPKGSAVVSGGETALRDFLKTDAGRALLSVSGDGEAIEIRRAASSAGLVTVIFSDSGPALIPGTQMQEWRGFVDLDGRLVTVGLRGLAEDPLTEAAGLSLLRDAVSAVTRANADPS